MRSKWLLSSTLAVLWLAPMSGSAQTAPPQSADQWKCQATNQILREHGWNNDCSLKSTTRQRNFSVTLGETNDKSKISINIDDLKSGMHFEVYFEDGQASVAGRKNLPIPTAIDPPLELFDDMLSNTTGLPGWLVERLHTVYQSAAKQMKDVAAKQTKTSN